MNNKKKRTVIIVSLAMALLLSGSALAIVAIQNHLQIYRTDFKIKQEQKGEGV
ncbi:hypothetical protein [Enterococcus viikkiensis]|uniref:hypothetical protein n=1 Tax=Enterococcus viikkiensis TaxID=930854 RepID=UPI001476FA95|nr:hypothetical protein [Enterococcus viikkiensis]